jgi:uncharacterized protein YgiM (DUF1202 family)
MATVVQKLQEEFAQKLAAAEQALKAGEADRLADAKAQWRIETDRRIAAMDLKMQEKVAEQVATAEKKWKADETKRVSITRDGWKAEAEERVAEAEARFKAELERRLAEVQSSNRPGPSASDSDAVVAAEKKWKGEDAQRLRQFEANWKVEEMGRFKAERAKWEAAEAQRMADAEARWRVAEEQRMAAALNEWRSGTDRLAQAKLRHAAQASRAQAPTTRRRSIPRLSGARLAFGSALLLLVGAGGYAYQSGMIDAFTAMESAPPAASTPETGATAQPAELTQTVYVKSGSINIRAEASAESVVIGSAGEGTPLTVVGRDGNWLKIRVPGSASQTGWVHTSRLDPNSLPPQ